MTNTYTFDEETVSDLHKDARGFRPREGFWRHWNESTMAEKQEIWDGLMIELEIELVYDRQREADAVNDFNREVARNLELGADNRQIAIQWILDGMNLDEGATGDHVAYELGLPYTMVEELEAACQKRRWRR